MDPITHGLLGASCAQATVGKKKSRVPPIAGALAAMAPDLDVIIPLFNNQPLSGEIWHRSFTHSLLFIPIGALIVSLFLFLFQRFRTEWKLTFIATFIGYSTHCLLDAATAYGTLLYWPFQWTRISWDIVAIVDPFVTLPLAAGLIWSIRRGNKLGAGLGLAVVALFLSFNSYQHYRAVEAVKTFGIANRLTLSQIRAMPALASSTTWQIIAKQNECFMVASANVPYWGKAELKQTQSFPAFASQSTRFKLSEQQKQYVSTFAWFSQEYLIVASENPLIVADGRYLSNYNPVTALWGYELGEGNSFKKIRQIPLTISCNKVSL